MPSALLWASLAETLFWILQIRQGCGPAGFAFSRERALRGTASHGNGRYKERHRLLLACGQSAEGELAFCGKESRNIPPGAMSFRYQMPLPAMTPLVKRQLRKIRRFSGVAIKNNISSNYGAAHAEPFQIVLFRFPASVQGAVAIAHKKAPAMRMHSGCLEGLCGDAQWVVPMSTARSASFFTTASTAFSRPRAIWCRSMLGVPRGLLTTCSMA